MTDDPIYLDHHATTPLLREVRDAMLPYLGALFGNPSSGHVHGQRAARAVSAAREEVAALLGASPDEILFTSGGTEANNLAIVGTTSVSPRRGVVTSVIEHPATVQPCARLERQGFTVRRLPVDEVGHVDRGAAERAIDGTTALVTVMHSNNETGMLQPIEALVRLAQAAGALVHTDAAQSVGRVPIDVRALGVDLLSVAGHKLHAPKGVGALYVRRGTPIEPLLVGAGHERGLRPGTENVAGIVGLGTACAIARRDGHEAAATMRALRDALWDRLSAEIPDLRVNGPLELGLPSALSVRFPGVSGNALLDATPEVAASTGSACHDGHDQPSAVILAMGVPPQEARGTVRLTLGRGTTALDVERAAAALVRGWRAAAGR